MKFSIPNKVSLKEIQKWDFFSVLLMALLFLRVFMDRSGLGAIIGLALLGGFFLLLVFKLKIPKYLLFYSSLFFLLVGYAFLNAVVLHGEPIFTFRGVIRYFSYFSIFIVAYYSKVSFKQIFNLYTVIVIIQSTLAIYQFLVLGMARPSGTFINSNHFSYFLVPYFSILLIIYKKYLPALFVFLLSSFLGGMGGVISLLLVVFLFLSHYAKRWQKIVAIFLFPIFIGAAGFLMQNRVKELTDVTTISDRLAENQAGGGSSLVWRIVTWKLMYDELLEKDGLYTGMGLEYASLISPYFLESSIREPHNDYVRILLEFGLFGLVLFLFAMFYGLNRVKKNADEEHSHFYYAIYAALAAIFLGMIVGNIVVLSTLWWLLLSIIAIIHKGDKQKESKVLK
ncbi:O-antigen ligase family protein [uncultured Cyclobacterium sp.]|uniref:O-antigen ligase family protein n=1 Tax=uncultured Cyclobacterium sp. TaxID=453820 RepID=UPI0030EF4DE1